MSDVLAVPSGVTSVRSILRHDSAYLSEAAELACPQRPLRLGCASAALAGCAALDRGPGLAAK